MEKLRIHSKGRSLRVADVIGFFSEITEVSLYNNAYNAVSKFHVTIHSLLTSIPLSSLAYVQVQICYMQLKFL